MHQIPKTKLNKHLSINLRQVYYKKIKKVKQIRNFFRPKSVFAEFRLDTEKKLDDGFELDKQFMKTNKFIKDPSELAATLSVLRKYYGPLKDQFNN